MKKILITILTLTIFECLYSQDRLRFSMSISPALSNSYLIEKKDSLDNFLSNRDYIEGRTEADKPLLGFKTEVQVIYRISNRISLYSGIGYLHQKISHSRYFPTGRYETGDIQIVFPINYYSYNATYNYLSLPIGILLKAFNTNKFDTGLHGSFSLDYLISKDDITPSAGLFEAKYYTVNDFCIEIGLGLNCNYKFNKKISLILSPNFNYFLTPNLIDKDAVSQHNYYTGLNFGLIYAWQGV